MSMVANLKQIAQMKLSEVLNNPDLVEEVVFSEEESDDSLDIDKAWYTLLS